MKKTIVSLFVIFGICFGISAGLEGFRYRCSDARGNYFHFPQLPNNTTYSVLNALTDREIVLRRGGRVRLPKNFVLFTVWTYRENDSGYTPVWQYEIQPENPCSRPNPEGVTVQGPLNECLGTVSEETVKALLGYTPPHNVFVVDGIEYPYGWNLSFIVDTDTFWEWDLYVDGHHILTFAQTESTPCHITQEFPQV